MTFQKQQKVRLTALEDCKKNPFEHFKNCYNNQESGNGGSYPPLNRGMGLLYVCRQNNVNSYKEAKKCLDLLLKEKPLKKQEHIQKCKAMLNRSFQSHFKNQNSIIIERENEISVANRLLQIAFKTKYQHVEKDQKGNIILVQFKLSKEKLTRPETMKKRIRMKFFDVFLKENFPDNNTLIKEVNLLTNEPPNIIPYNTLESEQNKLFIFNFAELYQATLDFLYTEIDLRVDDPQAFSYLLQSQPYNELLKFLNKPVYIDDSDISSL